MTGETKALAWLRRYVRYLFLNRRQVESQNLLANGCLIGSSHLIRWKETLWMLNLTVERDIRSWVEAYRLGEKDAVKLRYSMVF